MRTLEPPPSPRRGRAALILTLIFLGAVALSVGVWLRLGARCTGDEEPRDLAEQLALERAAALFNEKKNEEAWAALQPLLKGGDTRVSDQIYAAAVLYSRNDFDGARAWLEQALECEPDSPGAHYVLAQLERQAGELESALAHLETARRGAPTDLPLALAIGGVLENLDRRAEAEPWFREVLAEGSDEAGSWYVSAAYQLGLLLLSDDDPARQQEGEALIEEYTLLTGRGLLAPKEDDKVRGNLGNIVPPPAPGTIVAQPGELGIPVSAEGPVLSGLWGPYGLRATDLDGRPGRELYASHTTNLTVFVRATDGTWTSEVVAPDVEAAIDLDSDNDGLVELAFSSHGELRIARQVLDEQGARTGWTTDELVASLPNSGPLPDSSSDLHVLDYDHDGDLDLLATTRGGLRLFSCGMTAEDPPRPTYADVTVAAGLPADAVAVSVYIDDFDVDQDVDILLLTEEGGSLYSNLRGGSFELLAGATEELPEGVRVCVVGDVDGDSRPDLVISGETGTRIWLNAPSGKFTTTTGAERDYSLSRFSNGLDDLDADGSLDLWSPAAASPFLARLGLGSALERAAAFGPTDRGTTTDGLANGPSGAAVVADVDGDGLLDATLNARDPAEGPSLFVSLGRPTSNKTLALTLQGKKDNTRGVGAIVEVRAGSVYARRFARGETLHIGLGAADKADWVRTTWPNGVIQHEVDLPAGQHTIEQREGLVGSCPFLYTWNGEEYVFISDVLGITPLGLPMAPGMLVPPDHDEYVLVKGEQLQPKDGFLELQFTEELREVTYLDRIRLDVVDHPADSEVFPNERFCFPPFPEAHTHTVVDPLAPTSAFASDGRDWAGELAAIDDTYAAPFELVPSQFLGLASPHWIELTFDPARVRDAEQLRLVMTGWFYWTDASVNMACAEDERFAFVPPLFQVPDGEGGWRDAGPPIGFPAGKTKTMVIDVSDLLDRADPRLRVFTTLRMYWDSIRLAVCADDAPLVTTSLEPISGELWRRGFSDPVETDLPHQPETFDWERLSRFPRWNPHPGLYTRFGEVLPLLVAIDDRYVIMGSGEALTVRFDAAELPPLPDGWRRDYLVFLDGWAKDRDPNTHAALYVEPLPFHGMSGYPYRPDERFPDDPEHRAWRREWNTRAPEAWIEPLARQR